MAPAVPTPQEELYYVNPGGEAYHRAGCKFITREARQLPLQQAALGRRPCRTCFAQAPSPTAEKLAQASDVLEVRGTLVKMDDTPVPNVHVYYIPIGESEGSPTTTVELTKDGVTNPGALTDSRGRFAIRVPRDWSQEKNQFTVGLEPASIHGPTLPRLGKSGALVTFKVDPPTGKLDIGKIHVPKE